MTPGLRGTEDSIVDERPENGGSIAPRTALINTGAVLAVLLGIPCVFVGIFGAVGFITGQKLIAGGSGAVWGYLAVLGAYELNRRKFGWRRGSRYADLHLFGGTVAVSVGLILSGALHETMPIIALVPACSAIAQANAGHGTRYRSLMHMAVLAFGLSAGSWLYQNGSIGEAWLARLAALP